MTLLHRSPLVRHDLRVNDGALQLEQVLGLRDDPWLADHCLNGEAVLPAAAALEWMAQVAERGWPDWQVAEVRDLRVLSGIRLDGNIDRTLIVRVKSGGPAGLGEQLLSVEILNPAQKLRACYRATLRMVERLDQAPLLPSVMLQAVPVRLTAADAYRNFLFHGQRFRVLEGEMLCNSEGIDATVRRSSPQTFGISGGAWLFDPALLDAIPQLAIVWSRLRFGTTPLPSAIARVQRYAPTGNGPLYVFWRTSPDSVPEWLHYDAWVADDEGRVLMVVEGAEGAASTALNQHVNIAA